MPSQLASGCWPAGHRAQRLNGEVGSEQEEARGDHLLGATLGTVGVKPSAGEQPNHDAACEHLDQTVDAEPHQRDRPGSDARTERDRKLGDVPSVPTPGQHSRAPLQTGTLSCHKSRTDRDQARRRHSLSVPRHTGKARASAERSGAPARL
jgi:hypothetical protein